MSQDNKNRAILYKFISEENLWSHDTYNKSPIQRIGGRGDRHDIIDTIHCPLSSPQCIREPWTKQMLSLSKSFHRLSAYN